MRVGIIGSGSVGQAMAGGFLRLGHEVRVGTRDPGKLAEWLKGAGQGARAASVAETAAFGELLVLATSWSGTEQALRAAGPENFSGKVLIDITNPLDFSAGPPPKPAFAYPHSAGEHVQGWVPGARVVKAFNIVTAANMTDARMQEGEPDLFIAGNDAEAKAEVAALAKSWHWKAVHDMGDITQAHWLESLAMIWILFGFRNNHWTHAFKLLRK